MLHQLGPEITYLELLGDFRKYKSPRDKITNLLKRGELIRVKKGIYVLGEMFQRPYSKYILANLIYGPSYISGKTALSYYGAIPEEVYEIQSRSICKNKLFTTPLGQFQYKKIDKEIFHLGIRLQNSHEPNRNFFIATPEKAILEEVKNEKKITHASDIYDWIESNRIDTYFLSKLNLSFLKSLSINLKGQREKWLIDYLSKEEQ